MKIIKDFKVNPVDETNRRKKEINHAEELFTKTIVIKVGNIRE